MVVLVVVVVVVVVVVIVIIISSLLSEVLFSSTLGTGTFNTVLKFLTSEDCFFYLGR